MTTPHLGLCLIRLHTFEVFKINTQVKLFDLIIIFQLWGLKADIYSNLQLSLTNVYAAAIAYSMLSYLHFNYLNIRTLMHIACTSYPLGQRLYHLIYSFSVCVLLFLFHSRHERLFLGGPGSGKMTQCQKIIKHYSKVNWVHLSIGDMLRRRVVQLGTAEEKWAMIRELIRQGIRNKIISNKSISFIFNTSVVAMTQISYC